MENNFLVIVDVQPEFQNACEHMFHKVIDKVNNTEQNIICFYVGRELGQDNKHDVMAYYLENGIDESKVEMMRYVEKDFGFFRSWMDQGVCERIIVNAVKQLRSSKLNDSRDFSDSDWDNILTAEDRKTFYLYDEPIFYPNFDKRMFEIKAIDGFELIGGARHECLAEIDIYLKSMDKTTQINEDFCYGVDKKKNKNKKNR